MDQSEFEQELFQLVTALDVPEDKQRAVVDIVFWAMQVAHGVRYEHPDGVAPTRAPLSLDRIDELWESLEHKAPVYLARAVEREHGIGVLASRGETFPQDTP